MSKEIVNNNIKILRELMRKNGLNAYIVPSDDYHASEYVNPFFKEREFITGFTGSAGTFVITEDFAGLWTDGRYFLQAADQLMGTTIHLMKMGEEKVPSISVFLAETLKNGDVIGFDGRCVTNQFLNACNLAFQKENKNIFLNGQFDLIDEIWDERPTLSFSKIWELTISQSGKSREDKLKELWNEVVEKNADSYFLSSLEDIAWLLNLRANDIHDNPVFLSYFYMDETKRILFTGNKDNLSKDILNHLLECNIEVRPYFEAFSFVKELSGRRILVDENVCNSFIVSELAKSNETIVGKNPTIMMKAIKNETELSNIRNAHIKDGVAVTKFIYKMKKYRDELCRNALEDKEIITEIKAAEILYNLRKEQEGFFEESFDPIMAFAEHGAIVHYSATKESDIKIENRSFLLSDTGGQYFDGTTDITRTIVMANKGKLSEEEKKHYTLVLKSHLRLLNAKFPKGANGVTLDGVARQPLWEQGLDFNHGTGHGVGYILSVHEGPNAFRSPRTNAKVEMIPMVPGMITSDEPGLYFEGKYGIRLENLTECVEEENGYLGLQPLTFVPFDLEAVDIKYLNEDEIEMLNNYHAEVYDKLKDWLFDEELTWLKEATRKIRG